MKTAVIYARYSSEKQTDQSIEGQIRECTEYAKYHDILIVDTYIDKAMTGTNDNRTSFQKMLKDASKQAWDIVLVYKLDRFSRNKYEMAIHRKTLRDNGIRLVSAKENIPDSPEGIILESLLEGMAEYYSAELSQKVKRGMRESRLKGLYTGGHFPFGYKIVDHKPVLDEFNASVVKRIFEEYVSFKPVREIIEALTKEGVLYNNKPFVINTVYKMLRNEKYTGVCYYNGERYDNYYPRIIDPYIFELTQKRINENKFGKTSLEIQYLLKNKIICGLCGHHINGDCGTGKNNIILRYYKCSNRKKRHVCQKATIRKEILEDLVTEITIKVLDNDETINLLAEKIISLQKEKAKEDSTKNLLIDQKKEIEENISNIVTAIEKGIITNTTKQRLIELEKSLENVKTQIIQQETNSVTVMKKTDIVRFIKKVIKKEPRVMLHYLIKKIILWDDKIEIYYNYISNKKETDEIDHQPFLFYTENFSFPTEIHSYAKQNFMIYLSVQLYI